MLALRFSTENSFAASLHLLLLLHVPLLGIRTIARMDMIPKDTFANGHIPEGHNPEWTQSRMDTIPNGRNPECTHSRMDTIPNGHIPEWTHSRMDTIPNGHHPEWTSSRMDTIPNEHNPEWTQNNFNPLT